MKSGIAIVSVMLLAVGTSMGATFGGLDFDQSDSVPITGATCNAFLLAAPCGTPSLPNLIAFRDDPADPVNLASALTVTVLYDSTYAGGVTPHLIIGQSLGLGVLFSDLRGDTQCTLTATSVGNGLTSSCQLPSGFSLTPYCNPLDGNCVFGFGIFTANDGNQAPNDGSIFWTIRSVTITNAPVENVPEPATSVMILLGLGGGVCALRFRRR